MSDTHRVLAPHNLGVVACEYNSRTRVVEAEGPESLLAIYLVQGQPGIREILPQKIEKAREGMRREEKEKICPLRTGVRGEDRVWPLHPLLPEFQE